MRFKFYLPLRAFLIISSLLVLTNCNVDQTGGGGGSGGRSSEKQFDSAELIAKHRYFEFLPDSTPFIVAVSEPAKLKELFLDPKLTKITNLTSRTGYLFKGFIEGEEKFVKDTGLSRIAIFSATKGEIVLGGIDFTKKTESETKPFILADVSGNEENIKKMIDNAIETAPDPTLVKESKYDDIDVIQRDKDTFFAVHSGFFFLAGTMQEMESLLKPQALLSDNDNFQQHIAQIVLESDAFAYMDFGEMIDFFTEDYSEAQTANIKNLGLDNLTLSFAVSFADDAKLHCYIQRKDLSKPSFFSYFLSASPVDFEQASAIPAGSGFLVACSIKKPTTIFDTLPTWMKMIQPSFDAARFPQMVAQMEQASGGISIRNDLLAPMGETVYVLLKPTAQLLGTSTPPFRAIFIKLDDPQHLENIFRRLSNGMEEQAPTNVDRLSSDPQQVPHASQGIEERSHAGISYFISGGTYWSINEKTLTLAFNEYEIEDILEGIASKKTMDKEPAFISVTEKADEEACAFMYISEDGMSKLIESYIFNRKDKFEKAIDVRELTEAYFDYTGAKRPHFVVVKPQGQGYYFEGDFSMREFLGLIAMSSSKPQEADSPASEEDIEDLKKLGYLK